MKPISASEKLMFSTVRLETPSGSRGTGFFFNFAHNDKVYPTIVTNKHVVENKEIQKTKFSIHLQNSDGSCGRSVEVGIETKWIFHSKHDLCFCFILPLFQFVEKKENRKVFYQPIDESLIYSDEQLKELSMMEEVVMVGYPIGLTDTVNNLPLFRKGITSSHPAFDFNRSGVGVVDMACFPGSSGSPILIVNEGSFRDKAGNTYIGRNRVIFLGVLFEGPIMNSDGQIVPVDTPTVQQLQSRTPVMINLGYYIKASEILEFKKYITGHQLPNQT